MITITMEGCRVNNGQRWRRGRKQQWRAQAGRDLDTPLQPLPTARHASNTKPEHYRIIASRAFADWPVWSEVNHHLLISGRSKSKRGNLLIMVDRVHHHYSDSGVRNGSPLRSGRTTRRDGAWNGARARLFRPATTATDAMQKAKKYYTFIIIAIIIIIIIKFRSVNIATSQHGPISHLSPVSQATSGNCEQKERISKTLHETVNCAQTYHRH